MGAVLINNYESEKDVIVKRLTKHFAETPTDAIYIKNSLDDVYELGKMLGHQTGIRWEENK